MSARSKDQVLSMVLTDQKVAVLVAQALRSEHLATDAVVKRIARATDANAATVKKWYNGQNAPSAANLITLMRTYPTVHQAIVSLAAPDTGLNTPDRGFLLSQTTASDDGYGDRSVTITVRVRIKNMAQLNQRQLWFLGELQKNTPLWVGDITAIWGVVPRTAKRDLAQLVALKMVIFSVTKRHGHYTIVTATY